MKRHHKFRYNSCVSDERGVTIVLVAILMFVFLGIAALVVDLSHLYVVYNELQNAADAGALAGARFLYNEDGTEVNEGANQIAYDAARANKAIAKDTGAIAVDVNWEEGQNNGEGVDVQRGHWRFSDNTFTANPSITAVDLWGVSEEDLDDNLNFINAVRVVARRDGTPAASFFARIFGFQEFKISREAVAYIGYAGALAPGEVDLPIAICKQSLTGDPTGGCDYTGSLEEFCNIGFMLSDGQDKNTAAWTNFSQPCETASTPSMRDLLTCAQANPAEIDLGAPIGATNGVVDTLIDSPNNASLMDCWKNATYDPTPDDGIDDSVPLDADGDGYPELPWNVNLPVVDCPDNQVGICMDTCGAVNVNILWILRDANKIDDDAPRKMDGWSNDSADGIARWNDFVSEFNLTKPDGTPATYENGGFMKKSIYFKPDCSPHELKGKTGGHNYGILARIPVIVR